MVLPTWQFVFNSPHIFGHELVDPDSKAFSCVGDLLLLQVVSLQAFQIFQGSDEKWIRSLIISLERIEGGGDSDKEDLAYAFTQQSGNRVGPSWQSKALVIASYMTPHTWYTMAALSTSEIKLAYKAILPGQTFRGPEQEDQLELINHIDWGFLSKYVHHVFTFGIHWIPPSMKRRSPGSEALAGGRSNFMTNFKEADWANSWQHPPGWRDVGSSPYAIEDVHDWPLPTPRNEVGDCQVVNAPKAAAASPPGGPGKRKGEEAVPKEER